MNNIKIFFIFIWQSFLTFIIFRRKNTSTIMRRFCFAIVCGISTAIAVYICQSDLLGKNVTILPIVVAVVIFFAISLRLTLLVIILTCCLSLPGIYYTSTSTTDIKKQLYIADIYGNSVHGVVDTTTNITSGVLDGISGAFDNPTFKNLFTNMSNDVKDTKLNAQQSDMYQFTNKVHKNLLLLLIILAISLSAMTSFVCEVFSHIENRRYFDFEKSVK